MTVEEMKQRKNEMGYTNQQLAELSGIPVGTVSKIFAGVTEHPRYDTLRALERVFSKPASPYLRESQEKAGSGSLLHEPAASYGKKNTHTVEDFWNQSFDGPHRELIDGTFYDMGQPSTRHQLVISFLFYKFMDHVKQNNGDCITMVSPVGVQLDKDDHTMVEPDLVVVCDRGKFQNHVVLGAPDLILEVLSPTTRKKDMGIKAYKYERAGVREYWLIDPTAEKLLVYDFENDAFPAVYGFDCRVPVQIWQGKCQIDLTEMRQSLDFLGNQ